MVNAASAETTRPVIEVEGLTFTYRRATEPALRDVSFSVRPGEVFGLLGPSGAGKSTLQKLLTGQLRRGPASSGRRRGHLRVFGQEPESQGAGYFERIGVGFELPNHFPRLTAAENLRLFSSFYSRPTRPVEELLALVGLKDAADVRVSELSKGMMMRLGFARAILHGPELLFLDEPTSGLDPGNARGIRRLVRGLQRQGTTVVLTTHAMPDVEALCERVGFLVDGEMKVVDEVRALEARFGRRELVVEHGAPDRPSRDRFPLTGLGGQARFLQLLREDRLLTVHSQEASLDRVFVEVTGRRLAPGDDDDGIPRGVGGAS